MSIPAETTPHEQDHSGLLTGETMIAKLTAEDGVFSLTTNRLMFAGGGETESAYATARLGDITGVEILRRPRQTRSAWWGGIGLVAAIGVWEVSSNATVGGVAAVVVALISIALLADYWFRPAGVVVAFKTPGASVQGTISQNGVDAARQFIAEFERTRAYYTGSSSFGPTGGYGSF